MAAKYMVVHARAPRLSRHLATDRVHVCVRACVCVHARARAPVCQGRSDGKDARPR
jgi:hypothetical protein